MKKWLPILSIFILGFIAFYLFINSNKSLATQSPISTSASKPSVITQTVKVLANPTPAASQVGSPETLSIPKIGVKASIEEVGLDSQGRMDVPQNPWDVAWYDLGFKPGQDGNAVIDGHLDTKTTTAVFYNLKNLDPGDEIDVTDNLDHTYKFKVSDLESYNYDQLPLKTIFASAGKPRLVLITCDGTFDFSAENYSNRLVVYSDLSES